MNRKNKLVILLALVIALASPVCAYADVDENLAGESVAPEEITEEADEDVEEEALEKEVAETQTEEVEETTEDPEVIEEASESDEEVAEEEVSLTPEIVEEGDGTDAFEEDTEVSDEAAPENSEEEGSMAEEVPAVPDTTQVAVPSKRKGKPSEEKSLSEENDNSYAKHLSDIEQRIGMADGDTVDISDLKIPASEMDDLAGEISIFDDEFSFIVDDGYIVAIVLEAEVLEEEIGTVTVNTTSSAVEEVSEEASSTYCTPSQPLQEMPSDTTAERASSVEPVAAAKVEPLSETTDSASCSRARDVSADADKDFSLGEIGTLILSVLYGLLQLMKGGMAI